MSPSCVKRRKIVSSDLLLVAAIVAIVAVTLVVAARTNGKTRTGSIVAGVTLLVATLSAFLFRRRGGPLPTKPVRAARTDAKDAERDVKDAADNAANVPARTDVPDTNAIADRFNHRRRNP
jgi:hypothetical protein